MNNEIIAKKRDASSKKSISNHKGKLRMTAPI